MLRQILAVVLIVLAAFTPAWATSPSVVGGVPIASSDSTSPTTVQIGSPTSGQMVIVAVTRDGIGAPYSWPGGTTVLVAGDNLARTEVACFIATGSEGASIDVTTGGDAAALAWKVTDHNGDCTSVSVDAAHTSGNSTTPDPPNLDPAGFGTEDVLVIAIAGVDSGSDKYVSGPSGYDGYTESIETVAADVAVVGAHKALTAVSSENPGTFSLTTTDDWRAVTVIIRGTTTPAAGCGRLGLLGVC